MLPELRQEIELELAQINRLAIHLDGGPPRGETRLFDFRQSMSRLTSKIPGVLPHDLRDHLKDYLIFRYFFRNAYTFELKCNRIGPSVLNMESTLKELENEIDAFLNNIGLKV